MTLHEKLAVYEKVINSLKEQSDMVSTLGQLPIDQQVEGVRFMEFLKDPEQIEIEVNSPTTPEGDPHPPVGCMDEQRH